MALKQRAFLAALRKTAGRGGRLASRIRSPKLCAVMRPWYSAAMKSLSLLCSGLVAFGFAAHAADDGLIADGAKVEVLSEGYSFTEVPAVDRDGNVFFTDQ